MYKIAINTMQLDGKLPEGDYRWGTFNDSFQNKALAPTDILNAIYMGQSFTSWHRGRRKDENFICGQHVAVDLEAHDERSTLAYVAKQEFVRIYGSFAYTTPSHTTTDPRCRVLFFLDQPLDDAAAYEAAIGFIYDLFPGSDPTCIDSSRFFYGSKNCEIEYWDNVLPISHLRTFYARWGKPKTPAATKGQQQTKPVALAQPGKKLDADAFLAYAIGDASGEGRNKRGYRLARQLRELGLAQWETESYLLRYQQAVCRQKQHDYTEYEAMSNTKSAYRRPMGH